MKFYATAILVVALIASAYTREHVRARDARPATLAAPSPEAAAAYIAARRAEPGYRAARAALARPAADAYGDAM